MKKRLEAHGFTLVGNEPMKLTLAPKSYGYTGYEFAKHLEENGIVCEFCDPDYLVLMPTPEITDGEIEMLERVLTTLPKKEEITVAPPTLSLPERAMTPREAMMSSAEEISIDEANGRILSAVTVGCPPAVPIVVSGEIINNEAIEAFRYYGIDSCFVVK